MSTKTTSRNAAPAPANEKYVGATIPAAATAVPVELTMIQKSIRVTAICKDQASAEALVKLVNANQIVFSGKYSRS